MGCSRLVKQLPDFVPQRTSCLGFGDGYNENILAAMSKVGQGQLQAADSPEKFPLILAQKRNRLNHLTGDEFCLGSVGLLRAHSRIPEAIRSRLADQVERFSQMLAPRTGVPIISSDLMRSFSEDFMDAMKAEELPEWPPTKSTSVTELRWVRPNCGIRFLL